ncbi:peroxisomal membrane protein PEX13 [Panulirus ornatus]|uniref:peroxisomal membrane protein PEX13 n=1 Tax=Panulirus ornatus TaxID=150431 RepID=UPI003A8C70A1
MASPCKPWERNTAINHRQPNFNPDPTNTFLPTSPNIVPGAGGGGGGGGGLSPNTRPPLPPRPTATSHSSFSRPSYGAYGSYGNIGTYGGPYFGGGYGAYGGGYGNYSRFGMMGGNIADDNVFIHLAEESSRPAFQSIESIVHAFGSVSMMLESTYHAVYSSFCAVLRVAEHFSRMKSHFAQIFSAFAVVRSLRWLYRKLLYLVGLRFQDPSLEAAWRTTGLINHSSATSSTEADIKASKSSWPIIMFFAVAFGGPYLIWRLLSSLAPPIKTTSHDWLKGQGEYYAAVAEYSFQAGARNELTFTAGQSLFLAPKDQQPNVRGWLLASNGTSYGLVPANYIKILRLCSSSTQPLNTQPALQGGVASSSPESRVLTARITNIQPPKFALNNPSVSHGTPQTQLVPEMWCKPSAADQHSQDSNSQLPRQSSPASLQSPDHQILPVLPEEREVALDQSRHVAAEHHDHS